MNGTSVLVTGAAGFLAVPTIELLLRHGFTVRGLVRVSRESKRDDRVDWVQGDVRSRSDLANALRGIDVVIHLAVRKADQRDSFRVNVGGARNLVDLCRQLQIRRIINVSTQAAVYARRDRYGNSKVEADEVFTNSGLDVTTLILSLVYGSDQSGVFAKIRDFAERLPIIPIIGPGTAVFQPIHADDAARVIVACAHQAVPIRPRYEVGGPQVLTFNQMIGALLDSMGSTKRTIHLPWLPFVWAAYALRWVSEAPPITVSNVLALSGRNSSAILDIQPMIEELGVRPVDFAQGLESLEAVGIRASSISAG